ncbi:MAG: dephospho-CoA kinase [Bdellovibrionales bacterium]|nr:dephospho-CoA kinase [Bdellovibrionales bacterium]
MDWIGITGMMGAGKTTVSRLIEESGYPVEYADQVARSVLSPGSEGLREAVAVFGSEILNSDQSLNRAALAEKVFGHPDHLAKLEQITHPRIQAKVLEFREKHSRLGAKIGFYDVPLLFEKKLEDRFDTIVCVVSDRPLVVERLKKREDWSDEEIESRLNHQLSQSEKEQGSQYIISNNGSVEQLQQQVDSLLTDLLAGPKKNPHKV